MAVRLLDADRIRPICEAPRAVRNGSLSNWLVNKAKVEPKTVQGIPRYSKIQTTLDLYAQEDSDETRTAQGEFLSAVGMTTTVQ